MKKIGNHLSGLLSGVTLLILSSFVPHYFLEVMEEINKGSTIGVFGSMVIFYLAILGILLYVSGHIFHAYNKKVAKDFEHWLK